MSHEEHAGRKRRDVHVIIEHRVALAVLAQQPVCVRDAEIFEVKETVWVVLADDLNKSMTCL